MIVGRACLKLLNFWLVLPMCSEPSQHSPGAGSPIRSGAFVVGDALHMDERKAERLISKRGRF